MRFSYVLIAALSPVLLYLYGERWLGLPEVPIGSMLACSLAFSIGVIAERRGWMASG